MAAVPGTSGSSRAHVVVLGGGFGGLETAFTLRMLAEERSRVTLVSDQDHFFFKPNSIYVPFGLDPQRLRVPLARPTDRKDIELIRGRARAIDPERRRVELEESSLPYDYLVVATGAAMRAEEVPGLAEQAISTWTADDMLELRGAFEQLLESGPSARRVLFLIPPNNRCAGPLYEIVLMLDTWLRRRGVRNRAKLLWSTYEHSYIQAFGPRLHDVVASEFERRDIEGHHDWTVDRVEPGAVVYTSGETLEFDLLVAFPPYIASTPFPGLEADDRGFLATELSSRRLVRHPEIFAVGDAGDFPVKQAFLAFLQGDAAAAHLASELIGGQPRQSFDPVSMCVMEQFDKATFAQVPLQTTDDPARAIEVRPGAEADYRVGTSRAWRMGKKMLGLSVPWRFGRGEPFHGGAFWRGMDLGLRAMSGVFAK